MDFGAKRSLVKCDSILYGVILHLKDVELSPKDTMLFSRKDKKTANHQFSHFCRTDMSAGRKLFDATCAAVNIDPLHCNYQSIEKQLSTSIQVFNHQGFLVYCSSLSQLNNCILCLTNSGCYLVRTGSEPAYGNIFNRKRALCLVFTIM